MRLAPVFRERLAHALGERRVERIAELPPVPVGSLDEARDAFDAFSVGCAVLEADCRVGTVGDGVHAPAAQATMCAVGELVVVVFAVFAVEVGRREVIPLRFAALEVGVYEKLIVRLVELREWRVGRGKVLEEDMARRHWSPVSPGFVGAAIERRHRGRWRDANRPEGPEKVAVWVDKPPLAIVAEGAEATRRLKVRPNGPAAEAVAPGGFRMRREVCLFFGYMRLKFLI